MRAANWIRIAAGALVVTSAHAGQGAGDYRGLPADLAAVATACDITPMKSDRARLERYLADDHTLADMIGVVVPLQHVAMRDGRFGLLA